MKLGNFRFLVYVLLTAVLFSLTASGQVLKGSISGTVVDPQGAAVPDAAVKATNIETNVAFTTTSDGTGLFRFNLVPAGHYKVEVAKAGFSTALNNSVLVAAGVDAGMGTVKLAVGATEVQVEVNSSAPLLEVTQSQVTNTFTGTQLSNFAGVQENQGLDNMALFIPGVVASRDNGFSNTNGGNGFSVNGLRGRNNDQQIDGQNNNDNSVAGPSLFLSDPNFVDQYVAVTNQFGPEYGRNAGSVVNIITKSGTNNFHGSVYATENNSALDAMSNSERRFLVNADGTRLTKPQRSNDEFGGFTLGGPIVKDKWFIFGGFDQEWITTLANDHSDSLTPTPAGLAQLQSCFPNSTGLAAWSKFGPFAIPGGHPVATTVPSNAGDSNSPRIFVPLAISSGSTVCDNVPFGGVSRFIESPTHTINFVGRNDIHLGQKDTISGRYIYNLNNNFNLDFGDAAAGYPVDVPALSQVALISWTHNLTSRMVNEARISFNRLNVDFGGNDFGTVPTGANLDTGVSRVSFRFPAFLETPGSNATIVPGLSFLPIGPATNLPQARIVDTWQLQDNWNYVAGRNQFKAGVNFSYQRSPNTFLPTVNGAFRFDLWDQLISNTPDRVQVAQGSSNLDFREYDTFLYGGDDFKLSRSVTLNLGLTWSYYGQPANLLHDLTVKQESGSTPFFNPSLPLSVRTVPELNSIKNSFGPSVGFAWNPQSSFLGDGKTVVRGGYRLAYDPPFYNIYSDVAITSPSVFLQSFTGTAAAGHPLPAVPTGPNVRGSLASSLTPGVFDPRTFNESSLSPNFGPDRVHSWSLGVERQLSRNATFEVRYVGNHAQHLFQDINGNPFIADLKNDFPNLVPSNLTPCPASQLTGPGASVALGRVNCNLGVDREFTNTGFSYYNGLQTEFRANNLFKQLTLRTGYTWSHTTDNVSEIFSTLGAANTVAFSQNPLNFTTAEYANSGLDIPHSGFVTFVEQLPMFHDQSGFMGKLLGGWALSGTYILASGQPYTPTQAFVASATGDDFGDAAFFGAFNGGLELSRPFAGTATAPANSVGIFAADACVAFGACATAATAPNQLLSLNAINATPPTATSLTEQKVTQAQVRFIANGAEAQSIFKSPFGNVARNSARDAISNTAAAQIIKNFKLSERMNFEFHATLQNVFNHFNFTSIDPFIEDAGLSADFTGFGDPKVTNASGRRITFGMKFTF